ncbi:hyaluronan synthase [Streptococcus pyogenes]|uniref:hyaluronan synthase HasA n=1 Tax=Streptococcus pyogenes TaxID=1314 RepID=UPI00109BD21F|nr:hyaluronan synthase HasA [Streptococcus pyogenes]VGS42095.1 hyaluronan synthase [Streptococcus pyogenes]
MPIFKKTLIVLSFIFLISILIYLNMYLFGTSTVGIYGVILITYLVIKLGLSFLYEPFKGNPHDYKVAAVIPSYNEDAESLLETLKSVLAQTYPLSEIYIVDDGSSNTDAIQLIEEYVNREVDICRNVIVHRSLVNKGKRHAQAWAFERSDADVFLTVDSDTYIYPNALEELLKSFNDETVYAATGHLNARNRQTNLLTRLTDIRYDNAFGVERAAQSLTGNILVCSGPLSIYRREVIIPNLERYKNQTFLGLPVSIGDDRCLTNYAIDLGRTVYQSTARCDTDVPFQLKSYLKQQNRWNKSFFRESIISVKKILSNPIVALWTIFEVVMFMMLIVAIGNLLFNQAIQLDLIKLFAFLSIIFIVALCRNIHYMIKHPASFLLSPLYGILHLFVLQPLKLYSLCTIKNTEWGTRKKVTIFK